MFYLFMPAVLNGIEFVIPLAHSFKSLQSCNVNSQGGFDKYFLWLHMHWKESEFVLFWTSARVKGGYYIKGGNNNVSNVFLSLELLNERRTPFVSVFHVNLKQ